MTDRITPLYITLLSLYIYTPGKLNDNRFGNPSAIYIKTAYFLQIGAQIVLCTNRNKGNNMSVLS